MNPCRPVYTADQEARIDAGRRGLLQRWRSPPFSLQQPRGYTVDLGDEVLDGDRGMADRFIVRMSAPVLTPAWEQELQRLAMRPEHRGGKGCFHLYVPHARHLRARWLPVSVDAVCLAHAVTQALMIAGLTALALYIGAGPDQQQLVLLQ